MVQKKKPSAPTRAQMGTLNEMFKKLATTRKSGAPKARQPARQKQKAAPKLSKYAAALLHPFAKQAEGVRVPEPYSANTTPYKAHASFTLSSNTSQSCDCVVIPHPLLTVSSGLGSVSNGLPATINGFGLPTGVSARALVSSTGMAAAFKNYRVVAWGVRIKTLIDFTKSGGRVYVAVVPASQQVPITTSSDIDKSLWYSDLDVPYDSVGGGLPTTILNMPRARQFSVSELMQEGGVEITCPIVSPAAKTFNEASIEYTEQGLISVNGVSNVRTSLGYGSAAGHSQVLIYCDGIGTAGTATDVLTVDVVMHIEGTPNMSTTAGGLIPAVTYTAPPASPMVEHAAHAAVAVAPLFRSVVEKAKEEAVLFGQKKITDFFKKAAPAAVLGLLA